MSVHGEESLGSKVKEQTQYLREELYRLREQLQSQTDDVEIERIELLIGDIHAQIEICKITEMERTGATSATVEPRKSSRERKLTPKMQEIKQQETSQKEHIFSRLYETWKEQVRAARTKLKKECSDQDLSVMMDDVEELETKVRGVYEEIRSQSAPSTEIRRRMDSCTAVTSDLMGLLKVRMSEVGLDEFDAEAENARLRTVLNKEYTRSIFGTTITKSTVRSHLSNGSSQQHSITIKRVECAAQLAAKKAEMQMEEAIAAQKQELKKLEDQRDLQVMAAKLKAYSEADSGEAWDEDKAACSEVASCPPVPCKEIKGQQTCKNNNKEQAINNYDEAS